MPADLAAFLTERLDEAEAIARAAIQAGDGTWTQGTSMFDPDVTRPGDASVSGDDLFIAKDGDNDIRLAQAVFIAANDPARTLRAIAAKRAILGMHHPTSPHPEFGFTYPAAAKFCGWCGPGDNWQAEQEPDMFPFALWPCTHVRHLGSEWADHPAYQPEWTPEPATAP